MNNALTELVFIMDKSGSMSGLEQDTIGGFNAMLEKQKAMQGEAYVTTVLFDNSHELLHDRVHVRAVSPMTDKEYMAGGTTALLDAIGTTIHKIINAHKHTAADYRPGKVLMVITTDGHENASRTYSYSQIQGLVERQKLEFDWEFIFLGANIDAIATAQKFGIGADRAANYHADSKGTQLNFETVSEAIRELRASRALEANWKDSIDADYTRRGKG